VLRILPELHSFLPLIFSPPFFPFFLSGTLFACFFVDFAFYYFFLLICPWRSTYFSHSFSLSLTLRCPSFHQPSVLYFYVYAYKSVSALMCILTTPMFLRFLETLQRLDK
jgi:hypothetical protein